MRDFQIMEKTNNDSILLIKFDKFIRKKLRSGNDNFWIISKIASKIFNMDKSQY